MLAVPRSPTEKTDCNQFESLGETPSTSTTFPHPPPQSYFPRIFFCCHPYYCNRSTKQRTQSSLPRFRVRHNNAGQDTPTTTQPQPPCKPRKKTPEMVSVGNGECHYRSTESPQTAVQITNTQLTPIGGNILVRITICRTEQRRPTGTPPLFKPHTRAKRSFPSSPKVENGTTQTNTREKGTAFWSRPRTTATCNMHHHLRRANDKQISSMRRSDCWRHLSIQSI